MVLKHLLNISSLIADLNRTMYEYKQRQMLANEMAKK
jgi:hypothetical protein